MLIAYCLDELKSSDKEYIELVLEMAVSEKFPLVFINLKNVSLAWLIYLKNSGLLN